MASYASANMGRSFSGGINVAFICSESYFLQQQLAPPTPRRHAIFIFLVPLLLKFLQLQCQGQVASQFETHPKTVFVAITSLIVYFFAYDAELRSSTEDYDPVVTSRVKEVSGSLCLLSFALVLFPDSVRVILYLLHILNLAPKFVHYKLQMLWDWLHQRVISRFPRERCVRRAPTNRGFWFVTPASANRRYLPPLYQ
ncbi:hypothetical protein CsSME_00044680 [Camellia sinensis var. sinensis]